MGFPYLVGIPVSVIESRSVWVCAVFVVSSAELSLAFNSTRRVFGLYCVGTVATGPRHVLVSRPALGGTEWCLLS